MTHDIPTPAQPLWDEDRIWEYADRRTARYSGEVKNIVRYETSECMRIMLTTIYDLTAARAQDAARIATLEAQVAALTVPDEVRETTRLILRFARFDDGDDERGVIIERIDRALAWLQQEGGADVKRDEPPND